MKRLVVVALAAFTSSLGASASWAADDTSQLATPIEQCIRSNAAKVELAIPDLNQAVSFLVNGVCSAPINAEYERRLKLKEQQSRAEMQKACEQSKLASKSQDASSALNPMCQPAIVDGMANSTSAGDDVRAYGMQPHPAEAISLASQLLLNLRLTHLNSKSQ